MAARLCQAPTRRDRRYSESTRTDPVPNSQADSLACLITALERDIDLDDLVRTEKYFYASPPLCVIEAIFSIGGIIQSLAIRSFAGAELLDGTYSAGPTLKSRRPAS